MNCEKKHVTYILENTVVGMMSVRIRDWRNNVCASPHKDVCV